MKLYELATNYQQVWNMVDDPDTDLAVIEDTLQSIEGAINEKAVNIVQLVRSLEADAEIIKAEEKRLTDRRRVIENRVKWFKQYIQHQMELAGLDKIKTPLLTLALQNNPPRVEIDNLTELPGEYIEQRIDYVVDKKRIKDAIQSGREVPGARLVQGKSLRIR